MRTHRFVMILSLSYLSACVTGSGRLEERSVAVEDFDSIEAEDSVQLEVTRGDHFDVLVTTDDNVWESLDVGREGGTLHLRLRSGVVYTGVTLRASVTLPGLAALHLSDSGHARLSGFDEPSPRLAIHASGASEVEGGANVGELSLKLSGASGAKLTGVATRATVDASGASDADLAGLRSEAASVELSGASSGAVTAERSLDYDLSGASNLVYFGNPTIGRGDTSGASTAERR